MYIDVSFSSSAPQLNILVNDIPIVQVACVLCRASASIDWSLSHSYYLRIKLIAIKYSSEAFRVYIYYRNLKGEDITFYKVSNMVFTDNKETRRSS